MTVGVAGANVPGDRAPFAAPLAGWQARIALGRLLALRRRDQVDDSRQAQPDRQDLARRNTHRYNSFSTVVVHSRVTESPGGPSCPIARRRTRSARPSGESPSDCESPRSARAPCRAEIRRILPRVGRWVKANPAGLGSASAGAAPSIAHPLPWDALRPDRWPACPRSPQPRKYPFKAPHSTSVREGIREGKAPSEPLIGAGSDGASPSQDPTTPVVLDALRRDRSRRRSVGTNAFNTKGMRPCTDDPPRATCGTRRDSPMLGSGASGR